MVKIKKNDGTLEEFNSNKLRRSLKKAGAKENIANEITSIVKRSLHRGMTTKEVYRIAFREFRKRSKYGGLKYGIREAIEALGPKGFFFEKFVSRILQEKGYDTQTNQIVKGRLITHEIDIIAKKNREILMVEAKFHNKHWIYTNVQDALSTYARFLEVEHIFTRAMLVTNTKFSGQAKKYSEGMGTVLMGWKYPEGDSLEQNIDKLGLYPITLLKCINRDETLVLLHKEILLIRELVKKNPGDLAQLLGTNSKRANHILEEAIKCKENIMNGKK